MPRASRMARREPRKTARGHDAAELSRAGLNQPPTLGTFRRAQIHAAIARMQPLPLGRPVRLELAFHVGPDRKWWNLWKPTIDGMIHLLGQSTGRSGRQQPLDGRITELGLHQNIDPAAGHAVTIGITASCL